VEQPPASASPCPAHFIGNTSASLGATPRSAGQKVGGAPGCWEGRMYLHRGEHPSVGVKPAESGERRNCGNRRSSARPNAQSLRVTRCTGSAADHRSCRESHCALPCRKRIRLGLRALRGAVNFGICHSALDLVNSVKHLKSATFKSNPEIWPCFYKF
jgi:hypothetical protein